jgi:hypothetical protein
MVKGSSKRLPLNSIIPDLTGGQSIEKKRVLFDTNFWRYALDANAQNLLLQTAKRPNISIQIAPAVVFETLRLKDKALCSSLIKLMTNPCFERLMPEAYSESVELLLEIERLKPEWLRKRPDLTSFHRLRLGWSRKRRGFWAQCHNSPSSAAIRLETLEGSLTKLGRLQSKNARKEIINAKLHSCPPLDKLTLEFDEPVPGWNGDAVEPWRGEELLMWKRHLQQPDHAYRDWIEPFIDLDRGLLESSEWGMFWLYLSKPQNLPRQWLRWAFGFAQRFRKTSAGSLGDIQLATYLVDADLLVTADKVLLQILEEVRSYSPTSLPEGLLVEGGAKGVLKALDKLP